MTHELEEMKWDYNPVTSTSWKFVPKVGKPYRLERAMSGTWGLEGKIILALGVFEECEEEDDGSTTTRLFMVCLVEEKRRHVPLESISSLQGVPDKFFNFIEITEEE